jgi:hypothetical protein
MEDLKILVNGVEFHEINRQEFIVYGEEDRIPFMDSVETNRDPMYPRSREAGKFPFRTYKALVINNRFFGPKIN